MTTVADYLLQRLREWGVEDVFGYAGDGINGLLAAWEKSDDQPRFIQARHEEMAAFEACGYAKFSGRTECARPPADRVPSDHSLRRTGAGLLAAEARIQDGALEP